jgi:hypothetical protein
VPPRFPRNSAARIRGGSTVLYNERHIGQSAYPLDTVLQITATSEKTEQTTPRRVRHAALCALLVGGMLVLVGAGTTVRVTDQRTGAPLEAFNIEDASGVAIYGSSGEARLPFSLSGRQVRLSAPGYRSATLQAPPIGGRQVALEPLTASISVRDDSDQPLAEATLEVSLMAEQTGPGQFIVWPATGTDLVVRAPGFAPRHISATGETTVRLVREPAAVLSNARTGQPVRSAIVTTGEKDVEVNPSGVIPAGALPEGEHWILAPGYDRESFSPKIGAQHIAMRPRAVRGLYLTIHAVADQTLRGNVDRLLSETEANAVVIDVKGDRGDLSYKSAVPLAEAIGAASATTIPDIQGLLNTYRQRGVYTIARIVLFKDDRLARNGASVGADVAIRDARSGDVWVDGEGLAWVDPFQSQAWDYNVALAEEAARLGFDEVQFDYIRFPTDPSRGGSVTAAQYSADVTPDSRVAAIAEFLRRARAAVHQHGVYLGIDTFGYTAWDDGDLGIGQELEYLAPNVDYICPMVYPSTFAAGLPGLLNFPAVVGDPYRTVNESVKRAVAKMEGQRTLIRPWLQYFDDYPWQTRRRYDSAEIRAQIRATDEAGGSGWMLWDPSNRFERGGLLARAQ